MPTCSWGLCNSNSQYGPNGKRPRADMENVKFFPFPKPKTKLLQCKAWIAACGRRNFTVQNITKHSYVCSKHFPDGKPTEIHPNPYNATNAIINKKGKLPNYKLECSTLRKCLGKELVQPDYNIEKPFEVECDMNQSAKAKLMTQKKNNPEDMGIRTSLREIEKRIENLGMMQKNLSKSRPVLVQSEDTNKMFNGAEKRSVTATGSITGYLKLDPSGGTGHSHACASSRDIISVCSSSSLTQPTTSHSSETPSVHGATSKYDCSYNICDIKIGQTHISEDKIKNSEPLNLSSKKKVNVETNHIPIKVNFDRFLPRSADDQVKFRKLEVHKEATASNVLVSPPMQIRFQVPFNHASNRPLQVLPSATIIRPANPPVLRLPNYQQITMASRPSINQSSFVLNVASGSTVPRSTTQRSSNSKMLPTSTKPGALSKEAASFHKFRIVGTKITGFKPTQSSNNSPKPSTGQSVTSSTHSAWSSLQNSTTNTSTVMSLDPKLTVKSNRVSLIPSNSQVAKNVRLSPVISSHDCKKISFLDQIDLVPIEKAEKIRNRRYGRRRAVAHPVYSGGLYVSTTAADSSKRLVSSELLDIGLETIPTKRPRGRPKGSTNKRSFSPSEIAGGVNEEYFRILQEAKPSDVPTVKQSNADDLCEVCKKPGECLMCDTCSRLYHMSCLTPPLRSVPNGMWCCKKCKEKINDSTTATEWPGLLSIVHSFHSFNYQRELSLVKAREKSRSLKAKKQKLSEQKKLLAGILKEKVCNKAKQFDIFKQGMADCENLMLLLERLRCVINKTLDTA